MLFSRKRGDQDAVDVRPAREGFPMTNPMSGIGRPMVSQE
jgi:hypothetical protein